MVLFRAIGKGSLWAQPPSDASMGITRHWRFLSESRDPSQLPPQLCWPLCLEPLLSSEVTLDRPAACLFGGLSMGLTKPPRGPLPPSPLIVTSSFPCSCHRLSPSPEGLNTSEVGDSGLSCGQSHTRGDGAAFQDLREHSYSQCSAQSTCPWGRCGHG